MNATIEVPRAGAWFEGHFPGAPILPGVAQLMLVLNALGGGQPVPLQRIAFVRLRQLVTPGERLVLEARDAATAGVRFELRREGTPVANGQLVPGSPTDPPGAAVATATARMEAPPLDRLLPHRPPMRFLASILHADESGLCAIARVPQDCAMVSGDSAPALVAIEAAAQAAAAWEALQRARGEPPAAPRVGYLVAMRDVSLHAQRLPADRDFLVRVRQDALSLPLSRYRFEGSRSGRAIARGEVSTYMSPHGAQTVKELRQPGETSPGSPV
jgi:predicted hotdog family 3-hydroxylacyl-ACP dehydratase